MKTYIEVDIITQCRPPKHFTTGQAWDMVRKRGKIKAPSAKRLGQILRFDPRVEYNENLRKWSFA